MSAAADDTLLQQLGASGYVVMKKPERPNVG
jgi:hypothetical protein